MSDSFLNKSTVILNAIAITTALAIISGHLSLGSFPQIQARFNILVPQLQEMPR